MGVIATMAALVLGLLIASAKNSYDTQATEMEQLGFYVCVADLEDELIRALGAVAVEQLLDAQGELEAFRTFQHQPEWRGRTTEDQLRRFFGTKGGRKIQSAAVLVGALDLNRVPRPLERVLEDIAYSVDPATG